MAQNEEDVLFAIDSTEDDLANDFNIQESQTEKYLLFMSGKLLFGVPSEYVVEIITNHVITKLPLVPSYIRGIINLRGQIIPIVDIRILLGQDGLDNLCTIILNIDGTMVGILVDSVLKMVDIDKHSIREDPAQGSQGLVSGMCSLPDEQENQTMLVFDCSQILNQT